MSGSRAAWVFRYWQILPSLKLTKTPLKIGKLLVSERVAVENDENVGLLLSHLGVLSHKRTKGMKCPFGLLVYQPRVLHLFRLMRQCNTKQSEQLLECTLFLVKGEIFLVRKTSIAHHRYLMLLLVLLGLGFVRNQFQSETGVSDVVAYVAGRVWVPQFGQWKKGMIYQKPPIPLR